MVLLSGGESANSGKRYRHINIQMITDIVDFVN